MPLPEIVLSKKEAAAYILNYHNLDHPGSLHGKESILSYIRKVGCIQFDPLNVCGRNPDLVLQSRIKDYEQNWLRESLYEDRTLLDGWDKMMAISRIEDWPLLSRLRKDRTSSYLSRYKEVEEHLSYYLKEIRINGPLSSLYFKSEAKVDWAWGSSRLAKAALEGLFFEGKLSIHHREHTRRVYDLTERLLPAQTLNMPDPFKSEDEYHRAHILRRIASAGIAGFSSRDFWFGIAGCNMKCIRLIIKDLQNEGLIRRVIIENSTREWFAPSRDLDEYSSACIESSYGEKAVLLAPLDNIMWNRELIEDIFDFKYRWEVYTPAIKREYGYYVLPILYKGRLIGRCEPYLERKTNRLLLKGFWLQEGIELDNEDILALRLMFSEFCRFLKADKMVTTAALGSTYRNAFKGITSSGG
jgi:uncharacterized protein